jgi:plastocyanin
VRAVRRLALVALVVVAVAGCGKGDSGPVVESVEVNAVDNRFEPDHLTVPEGRVEFNVTNEGSVPHTFVIAGIGFKLKPFETGARETGTVALDEPGDVFFYCDIEGHREDGMEGVLTVTKGDSGEH